MENFFKNNNLEIVEKKIELKVDCLKEFGKTKGLHKKTETTIRFQAKTVLEKILITKEVVTDFNTGKTVIADIQEIGPKKSKITWDMLAFIIENVVKFCLPIDRLANILSVDSVGFSSGRICSYLSDAATKLVPVYLYLAELLSEAEIWNGDDSRTRVVEIRKKIDRGKVGDDEPVDEIVKKLAEELPRFSKLKSGKDFKKQISISALIGKSDPSDCRSTIYFYRTHVGDLGNLISHLLCQRRPKNRKLKLVTDQLSANKPDEKIGEKFLIEYFACSSHARRPFWRYRNRDLDLCYYMLRGFALLSKVESMIDRLGRTNVTTLKLRKKYSMRIWLAIYRKCQEVLGGNIWLKGSNLYDACEYIVKHFPSLVSYIDVPEVRPDNNISERILRVEKIMANSSKFRVTEKGRVVIDILRTIVMTCSAAGVPVRKYLVYALKNSAHLQKNPENFTPFAYAKLMEQKDHRIAG